MPGSLWFFRHMPLITMMFTDVVESTATKRDISFGRDNRERDHAYLTKVQTPHFELIRACYQAHQGREVSTIGDAFFLAFDDPAEAVRCAVHIQKRLNESPIETPLGPLRVRIGIHSGFPEFFESSWHGTDVDTAARVEAAAEARQIVVSTRTYELTRDMTDAKFYPLGEVKLKGVGQVALWEVDWQGKGPSPPRAPAPESLKRQKRIKMACAAALVAALLAGTAVLYRYKVLHRPVVPQAFQVPATDRRSVAVVGFKNVGKPEVDWLAGALSEILSTELGSTDAVRTISPDDVSTARADLALAIVPTLNSATLSRIRRILHSEYVISGAYLAMGNQPSDSIHIDVHLQDANSGETISSFGEDGTLATLSQVLRKVATGLRGGLGINDQSPTENTKQKSVLPSDPEALRLYSEGLARIRVFDALGAQELLQKSIAVEPNLALPHFALARAWKLLGYDGQALEEAKKAVELSSDLPTRDQKAIEAEYRELNAEWDKAIAIYQALWELYPREPNYALALANAQTTVGKGLEAMSTLEKLAAQPHMDDDPRVDLSLALAAESLPDVHKQRDSAASAVRKASRQGSRLLAAHAYWQLCSAYYSLGQYQNGEAACDASHHSAPFDDDIEARSESVWASILEAQGKNKEALAMRRNALETARKIGSQKDVVGALQNLANLLESQGNVEDAKTEYASALQLARQIGDRAGYIDVANSLAGHLYSSGDLVGAETLYRESLRAATDINNQGAIANALINLGNLQSQLGQLGEAEKNIKHAIVLFKQAGLEIYLPAAMNMLGDLYVLKGNLSGARQTYKDSLDLSTKQGSASAIASSRAEISALDLEENKAADAESLARQAAEEFASEKLVDSEAGARITLARALLAQNRLSEAETEIEKATKLSPEDRTVQLSLVITSADVNARNGLGLAAKQRLDEALAEAKRMKLVGLQLEIGLARAELEAVTNSKASGTQLQLIENDAKAKGYILIAAKAERFRRGLRN